MSALVAVINFLGKVAIVNRNHRDATLSVPITKTNNNVHEALKIDRELHDK